VSTLATMPDVATELTNADAPRLAEFVSDEGYGAAFAIAHDAA
jgi:hypothetical protein